MQTSPLTRRLRLAAGVVGLILAGLGWWLWLQNAHTRTTDDAFVDGDIITVVSEAQGSIKALSVRDNAHVERGAAILQIEAGDLKLALDAALAGKDSADAQLDEVKAAGAAGSSRRKMADAAVRLAGVRVSQAQLSLSKTEVIAPASGYVAHRMVGQGDSVRTGQPLLAIVVDHCWITANLKETQLAGVKPGDLVDIRIDAFSDLRLTGHVESLQQGAGQSFSLLPPENASGNFVKVVQRVPVKIALDATPNPPLPPGLSAPRHDSCSLRRTIEAGARPIRRRAGTVHG